MDKWADYLISAVRSNPGMPNIDSVQVHSDFGNIVCETCIMPRALVIEKIKGGCRYATVYRTPIGKWRKGQDVRLVTVGGVDYLRTDSVNMASDNFDNVPEF
jgi:hypothetical protein